MVLGGILILVLRKTRFGTALRAIAIDPIAAGLTGINVLNLSALAFALGGAMVAVSGALVSTFIASSASSGIVYTLKALIVIIVGGPCTTPVAQWRRRVPVTDRIRNAGPRRPAETAAQAATSGHVAADAFPLRILDPRSAGTIWLIGGAGRPQCCAYPPSRPIAAINARLTMRAFHANASHRRKSPARLTEPSINR